MKEQNPRDSKCWTCKFGHCIVQTQREILFAEMEEVEDAFSDGDFDLGLPDFEEPSKGHVHQVEKHGVFGLCHWTPQPIGRDMIPIPPVAVQIVHECNRYEKLDAKPTSTKDL